MTNGDGVLIIFGNRLSLFPLYGRRLRAITACNFLDATELEKAWFLQAVLCRLEPGGKVYWEYVYEDETAPGGFRNSSDLAVLERFPRHSNLELGISQSVPHLWGN